MENIIEMTGYQHGGRLFVSALEEISRYYMF